jgi:hypothetical protein
MSLTEWPGGSNTPSFSTTPQTTSQTTSQTTPQAAPQAIAPLHPVAPLMPPGDPMDWGYQTITLDSVAPHPPWQWPTLYKRGEARIDVWKIAFDGQALQMRKSVLGGIITPSQRLVEPVSRPLFEQGLLEGNQRYRKKVRAGYQPAEARDPPYTKPMKGYEYNQQRLTWPVLVSPKLDGIRMLLKRQPNGVYLPISSGNKLFHHLEHLVTPLQVFCGYLPLGAMLDGELYTNQLSFEVISGIARSTVRRHPQTIMLQYYMFDVHYYPLRPFEERYRLLTNAYQAYCRDQATGSPHAAPGLPPQPSSLFHVLPHYPVGNRAGIMQYHQYFVAQGYEGVIIRRLANGHQSGQEWRRSLYHCGRCVNILKYKDWKEEEMTILAVFEGQGTEAGCAMFQVRNQQGKVFAVRLDGSFEYRRLLLGRGPALIGKPLTVKYQELNANGIPRFATGKALRDYET